MNDAEFIQLVVAHADPTRDHEVRLSQVDYDMFVREAALRIERHGDILRLYVNSEEWVSLTVGPSNTPGMVSFCPLGNIGSRHILFYERGLVRPEYASRFERDFDV